MEKRTYVGVYGIMLFVYMYLFFFACLPANFMQGITVFSKIETSGRQNRQITDIYLPAYRRTANSINKFAAADPMICVCILFNGSTP